MGKLHPPTKVGGFQFETVRSHLNGVWDNDTLYNDMKEKVDKHIEELMSFEKLDFYWV